MKIKFYKDRNSRCYVNLKIGNSRILKIFIDTGSTFDLVLFDDALNLNSKMDIHFVDSHIKLKKEVSVKRFLKPDDLKEFDGIMGISFFCNMRSLFDFKYNFIKIEKEYIDKIRNTDGIRPITKIKIDGIYSDIIFDTGSPVTIFHQSVLMSKSVTLCENYRKLKFKLMMHNIGIRTQEAKIEKAMICGNSYDIDCRFTDVEIIRKANHGLLGMDFIDQCRLSIDISADKRDYVLYKSKKISKSWTLPIEISEYDNIFHISDVFCEKYDYLIGKKINKIDKKSISGCEIYAVYNLICGNYPGSVLLCINGMDIIMNNHIRYSNSEKHDFGIKGYIDEGNMLRIKSVREGSMAYDCGIRNDDIVLEIDDMTVEQYQEKRIDSEIRKLNIKERGIFKIKKEKYSGIVWWS